MKLLLSLVGLCTLTLAGCATGPTTPADPAAVLNQHQWNLVQAHDADGNYINALFARPDKPLTLGFQDGRIHVANACNILNGQIRIEGDKLLVQPMISTMMACADPAVRGLDKAISTRLEGGDTFRLDTGAVPPTLTLITPDGDTLVFHGTSAAH